MKVRVTSKTNAVLIIKCKKTGKQVNLIPDEFHDFDAKEWLGFEMSANGFKKSGWVEIAPIDADEPNKDDEAEKAKIEAEEKAKKEAAEVKAKADKEAKKKAEEAKKANAARIAEIKAELKELEKEFKRKATADKRKVEIKKLVATLKAEAKSLK